jgi:hypothetical protein
MIVLGWWEEALVGMAISLLTILENKLTNPVEVAALQAAVAFLQRLVGGGVAGIQKPVSTPHA